MLGFLREDAMEAEYALECLENEDPVRLHGYCSNFFNIPGHEEKIEAIRKHQQALEEKKQPPAGAW